MIGIDYICAKVCKLKSTKHNIHEKKHSFCIGMPIDGSVQQPFKNG
jgi:hypothetical protein